MAHWFRALVALAKDPGLIPSTPWELVVIASGGSVCWWWPCLIFMRPPQEMLAFALILTSFKLRRPSCGGSLISCVAFVLTFSGRKF